MAPKQEEVISEGPTMVFLMKMVAQVDYGFEILSPQLLKHNLPLTSFNLVKS